MEQEIKIAVVSYGEGYAVYNVDTYDGAPDAGVQIIGFGNSEDEARADYFEKVEESL